MSSPLIPVILSGGNGTRLWPLSRENILSSFKTNRPQYRCNQQYLG